MNIFITGGTGFFGKSILRFWAVENPLFENIFILSRDPTSFLDKHPELSSCLNIKFIKGDISQASDIALGKTIDYVLHAATDSTLGPSLRPLDLFNQIATGTEEVLKFAVNHHCKRFLLTSSGSVYGPQPKVMDAIPESYLGSPDCLSPDSAYGLGKKNAEHLCSLYSHQYGFEYVVARCFAFVGEDLPLNAHFAIGNFVRDALMAKEIVVKGDGSPLRTYLYQNDLAKWLTTILEKGLSGHAYNVGSDEVISVADLAYLVRDLIAPEQHVRIIGKCDPMQLRNRYVPDIRKVTQELGLNVNTSLVDSLHRTIEGLQIPRRDFLPK